MMKRQLFSSAQKTQEGAVLVVGLMLLLIMTVLALSGSTSAITTSRLVNNLNKESSNFQAAQDVMTAIAADPSCFSTAATAARIALSGSETSYVSLPTLCNGVFDADSLARGSEALLVTTAFKENSGSNYVQVNIRVDLTLVRPDNSSIKITQGFTRNF